MQLAEQLDLPRELVAVLRRRGHSDPAILEILEPAPAPPPEQHFPDLPQAVERLRRAIAGGEAVAVCGDYDADGMTSTALLVGVVQRLGGVAKAAIPSRMEEGYGLNPAMVERLHQEGVGLLVTVDNGISARPALEKAQALGVEVIVTDHHAIPARRPPYLALLHPALTPAESPYGSLAGWVWPICWPAASASTILRPWPAAGICFALALWRIWPPCMGSTGSGYNRVWPSFIGLPCRGSRL